MDKPIELYVSNDHNDPQKIMHISLPFQMKAVVVSNGIQSLDWLKTSLQGVGNLHSKSCCFLEPYLANNQHDFNLVLLVLPNDLQEAESALKYAANFDCDIVILGLNTPQQVLRLAFQFGVTDFIPQGSAREELVHSIEKISSKLLRQAKLAPVIAVVNGKAGSGASFISASLADIASTDTSADVALLDLDLHQGSLAHMLGRAAKYSICDVLTSIEALDEVALKSTLTNNAGVSLLAAKPYELLMLEQQVDFSKSKQLLWKFRHFYKQVILDLSRGPELWNYQLLTDATILIVTQQHIMHLRQTKDLVTQLTQNMGIAIDNIHLIVNRYDKNSSISIADVKETIGIERVYTIVNDYKLASECVELSQSITELGKKQKLVADFRNLAQKFLLDETSEVAGKKGFWQRVLGK